MKEAENKALGETMAELNRYVEATAGVKVNGSTDITGFGLIGQLEMAKIRRCDT